MLLQAARYGPWWQDRQLHPACLFVCIRSCCCAANEVEGDPTELPGEPFGDCDTRYDRLSYLEYTIPAGDRVIVRMLAYDELSCIDTEEYYPLALDIFDITNLRRKQGGNKAPGPASGGQLHSRMTPEEKQKAREAKEAKRRERQQKKEQQKQAKASSKAAKAPTKAAPGKQPVQAEHVV